MLVEKNILRREGTSGHGEETPVRLACLLVLQLGHLAAEL
jgi:hypothetical protein